VRQLNSCRMGELGVHRRLLIKDSNGDISREATKLIGRISPEAMRSGRRWLCAAYG
jgi:hypothetical protein